MERSGYHHILILSVIALVGLLCYSNTFQAPFQFDDLNNITSNRSIYLKELSWQGLVNAAFGEFGNRPVSNVTFAVNYYLGGLDVWGYHVFNWAVHVASAMILYGWIYQTLGLPFFRSSWSQPSAYRVAVFSSLLWVAHPVQTQAVTYIVQRATSMATLFYLSCLFTYLLGRTSSGWRQRLWYIATISLAFLALGSKEIAITLPVVILLYDAFFICGLEPNKLRKRILFYSLIIAIPLGLGGIRFFDGGMKIFIGYQHPQEFTMMERLLTEGRVLVHYFLLLAFPHPSRLTVDYYFPLSRSLLDPLSTLLSWVFILGLIGTAIFYLKRAPLISFFILWFFVNLALESTVIMLDLVFEHRLYLPSVGMMVLLAVGVESVLSRVRVKRVMIRLIPHGALVVLLALWGTWTWERNWVWNDNVALWLDVLSKYPENRRAHGMVGGWYMVEGKDNLGLGEDEGSIILKRCGQIRHIATDSREPSKDRICNSKNEDAHRILSHALELFPNESMAYYSIGAFMFKQGEPERAVEYLERAAHMEPNQGYLHNDLGLTYLQMGRLAEAFKLFRKAHKLDSSYVSEYDRIGNKYLKRKEYISAIQFYNLILEANPGKVSTLYNLGLAYNLTGDIRSAITVLEEVTRLNPNWPEAYNNLGVSYGKAGYLDKAVDAFREAVRLSPQYGEALYNLARAYELLGARTLANEYYERARQGSSKLIPADTGKN